MLLFSPNPILFETSLPVDFSTDIKPIVEDMFTTMYKYNGVGLSAIQIGVRLRLIVADVEEGREIYINPKIERLGNTKKLAAEGCLSFPGIWDQVLRSNKITISYQDLEGNTRVLNTSGLRAQMLQHEIEHLDGILLSSRWK